LSLSFGENAEAKINSENAELWGPIIAEANIKVE